VFFKGCPLRCKWCQNPETHSPKRQMFFSPGVCIRCDACVTICKQGAITLRNGKIETDFSKCINCGRCADVCMSNARKICGEEYSIDRVLDVILRDKIFYHCSGSGVTLSGGEVTLFADFATDLFLYDIKHIDDEKHRAFTGQGIETINDNLLKLRRKDKKVIIRIPLIPGFNDDIQTVKKIGRLALKNSIKKCMY